MVQTAYADVADVEVTKRIPSRDGSYLGAVERYLADATAELTELIGYSFFRSPETGTETWITTGSGTDVLHAHEGIAELTKVEIRTSVLTAWVELDTTTWVLESEPGNPLILDGEPAFHVALLPGSLYERFPAGRQLVRLTGARGWSAVPARARSATVAIARQRLGTDQTGQGGPLGPDELESRPGPERWPKVAYELLMLEQRRHRACAT